MERIQHLYMRVAVALHMDDVRRVAETYVLMARGLFIHASPTLFNAGMVKGQLSSCFVLPVQSGSIQTMFSSVSDIATISHYGGGLGVSVHDFGRNRSVSVIDLRIDIELSFDVAQVSTRD